jgi:hypothetical protein
MAKKHKHKGPHAQTPSSAAHGGTLTPPPLSAAGQDQDEEQAPSAPMPGRHTFSAAEEQAMRGGSARSGSPGLPPPPGGMDNDGDMD